MSAVVQNNTLCKHAQCAQSPVYQKYKRSTVYIYISRHKIIFGIVQLFLLVAFVLLFTRLTQPKQGPENELDKRPLLTIFTAFGKQSNSPEVRLGYERILRNWSSFPLDVHPVLFVDAESDWDLVHTAVTLNWSILPIVKRDDRGLPILKEMYRAVYRSYTSMLYGYASDDLLFDESLVKTLQGIFNSLHLLEYNVLLTGKPSKSVAREYVVPDDRSPRTTNTHSRITPTSVAATLPYLFFTRKGCWLNWLNVPDTLVVRRSGFLDGNDVVTIALQDGVNVIDASDTLSLEYVSPFHRNTSVDSTDRTVENEPILNFDAEIRMKTARKLDSKVFVQYT